MAISKIIEVQTQGRGLYAITEDVLKGLKLPESGMLNLFIQHTSASLLVQENFDPTAKADIEEFFCRLIPDTEKWYSHDAEGPDDSTSHLKAALTPVSLNIPVVGGRLGLGQWQGIYLFEHRLKPHRRKIVLTLI